METDYICKSNNDETMGKDGKKHLWWHFLPPAVMALILAAFMVDPWMAFWGLAMIWPVVLALVIAAIIALVKGVKRGGRHKKWVLGSFGVILLGVIAFLLIRLPAYNCNPEKMARHYEKTKDAMDELVAFTLESLGDEQNAFIEFQFGKVSNFRALSSATPEGSETTLEGLMYEVGLDEEELASIQKKLKGIKCISLDTHFPAYCDIGYKRVGFALYSYRVFLNPMTPEQRRQVLTDSQFIPYNYKVALMFGGGAVGPQAFSQEYKEEFLKKNPPQWRPDE